MFRSELIKLLQEQNNQYGDRHVYIATPVEDGITGMKIKSIGLDCDDNTVIDITD